ncbi:SGNH/GDSL hydrolase family protein [Alicyclobacillus cycloheptanicus]|uniref:Lysophospholipase L1-like esterase n=1 Tax=Alicyclobacillus cycloheptanicus TaxID=1457 RepID=A0ABT9XJ77_9BACL|nr:SGNH/GDSL hydrolase family protein [Alicyclobacillus cycloheptanicus]MDQ0190361.1 lysophospholipase L1-like esterase [Alicyclobacillus cycloheptanicus]WDM00003.1 SGNH/GDSL hydrolase family protein [Alicyclobacillus cycloheptanicus]
MRVVCAGDSLTRGVSYIRGRLRIVRETYPSLLQSLLEAYEGIDVVNSGAFNDNSDSLLQRLDKDVLSQQPDVVLIEIGANDADFRWQEVSEAPDEEHVPNVPIERYLKNMGHIVQAVQRIGARPIVLTLLPLDPVRYYQRLSTRFGKQISHWIARCGGIEYWHNRYDKALRKCLEELRVDQIDVRAEDEAVEFWRTMLSDDGIHLTAAGYQHLSRTVFSALKKLGVVPLVEQEAFLA